MGKGLLIIGDLRSHSDTPQSVGLLWTSDQLVAETSTWQQTTLITDRLPCPRRDSKPQSQQANVAATGIGPLRFIILFNIYANIIETVLYKYTLLFGSSS